MVPSYAIIARQKEGIPIILLSVSSVVSFLVRCPDDSFYSCSIVLSVRLVFPIQLSYLSDFNYFVVVVLLLKSQKENDILQNT